jgi:outer membrane protein TolC
VRVRQSLLPRKTLWGDMALGEREADQAELEALEQLAELRHRVALAWISLLLRQESLVLSRQDLELAVSSRERAAARLAAGLIAESDYMKVELDELRLRSSFQADSLEGRRGARDFLRLLGQPLDLSPVLEATLPALDPLPPLESLKAALSRDHADLAARRLEKWRARRELRRQQMSLLPELDLDLAWTLREEDAQWLLMPEDPSLDRSLRLGLAWPLFTAGASGRALERARIAMKRQELQTEAVQESLEGRLEQLWLQAETQRLQQPLVERQLDLARKDADISRLRFQSGQITSRELIDADRALSRLRVEDLQARLDMWRTRLELERLTGQDRAHVARLVEEGR